MAVDASHSNLRARIEAWPFRAAAGFDLALVKLRRDDEHLKRTMGQDLHAWASGRSLDALALLCDSAWFSGNAGHVRPLEPLAEIRLHRYLGRLAREHLEIEGAEIRLRWCDHDAPSRLERRTAFERALHYRWLTLQLPADLLAAALVAPESERPMARAVRLVTPGLRVLLERGLTQNHLHVGASLCFAELWTLFVARLAWELPAEEKLQGRGPCPFGSARRFRAHLLQAALVRLLLAAFIEHRARADQSLREFVWSWLEQHPGRRLRGWGLGEAYYHCECAMRSLEQGTPPAGELAHLRGLYSALARPLRPVEISCTQDLIRSDPICDLYQPRLEDGRSGALPEMQFACRALRHLERAGGVDAAFEALFWQYQRVRCFAYGHVVEGPGIAGLDWFTQHYERIGALRGDCDDFIVTLALEADVRDANIRSFEVRTAPPPAAQSAMALLRGTARQVARYRPPPGSARPEFGVVLHFVKTWSGNRPQYGPRRSLSEVTYGRYSAWYVKQLARAIALEQVLRRDPRLVLVLRGLDVCNVELAIPSWPVAALFQRVRSASARAAARLAEEHPRWQVPAMRATCHVGEEFRRLAEGLRRMHEVLEFGVLQRGDRVGHGLALGEDPVGSRRLAPRLAQPCEERLDDLLWELARYTEGDLEAEAGRVEFVRAESAKLACMIYDIGSEQFDAQVFQEARARRHDTRLLATLGYPYTRRPQQTEGAIGLLRRYLFDDAVFRRGHEPIEVSSDSAEVRFLTRAQNWLRRAYADVEIAIECNPTSNLIVGDYSELSEHPALSLRPLPGTGDPERPPLLLSINADDPTTFATCLADEYAYIYFALIGTGVSSQDALTWLEGTRESGWLARFTVAASKDPALLAALGGTAQSSPTTSAGAQSPRRAVSPGYHVP